MPFDDKLKAPGLKRRGKSKKRLYWCARADIAKAGFTPRVVPLHYNIDEPADRRLIEAKCQILDSEMKAWIGGHGQSKHHFDGTILSLSRRYQTDDASPFREHKWNWRDREARILKTIEAAFGDRSLSALGMTDFRRWYDVASRPKAVGGPARVDRAAKIIKLLRQMIVYGKTAELPHCGRLAEILRDMRFKNAARRREKLELHHVEAFVSKAIEMDRFSLAFATTIQFETMMRQKDVIGEWEPLGQTDRSLGIVFGSNRWANGLTWADIPASLVVKKVTTKTGATVVADWKLCPLLLQVLDLVPHGSRIGPVIINEKTGMPYFEDGFAREWRVVANAAGIPKSIKNMDARAGAISEADDALAPLDEIRSTAGHAQSSTTTRYIRGTAGKSKHVAELRQLHRDRKRDENGN